VSREGEYLVGKSADRESLEKMHLLLRSQGILDSARDIFLKEAEGNQLTITLNKQAAHAGAVNFHGHSYLGSIHVTITTSNVAELIDWLAPSTGGKH
ncbi:MAG: RNA-binding domain-containing protein, partial [Candidatus Hydrothermarchaeota archaeon]|nr:RNA-binding domain-containing protein [Candidatus Hydrothermarchaeota archaeon]